MKQEDKELLIKDLLTRLPYGVKVQYNNAIYNIDYISALYEEIKLDIPDNYTIGISEIKPYLRSMSSMTEEEKEEYCYLQDKFLLSSQYPVTDAYEIFDWLNKKMFDYRGLIPMDLAVKAPEGMY